MRSEKLATRIMYRTSQTTNNSIVIDLRHSLHFLFY